MNKKIAIIGKPGAWSTEHLSKKLAFKNFEVSIFDAKEIHFDSELNQTSVSGVSLDSFDAIIIKKLGDYQPEIIDRLNLLQLAESCGVRFYSSPSELLKMISRISCTTALLSHEVPMPNTFIGESAHQALEWLRNKKKVVFKPNFSTKAKGMQVLSSSKVSLEDLTTLKKQFGFLYLQEKLDIGDRDFGLAFIGDKFIGAYARVASKSSWNTTTKDGGHYAACELNDEIISVAQKAKSAFNLDFCSVDIAIVDDKPLVFEVSAFGGFNGLLKGANIDAAELLAQKISSDLND